MSLAPHLEPGTPTRALQRALLLQGYDCGGPDGVPGPRTHAALARWAAEHSVSPLEAPALIVAWHEVPATDRLIVGGTAQLGPAGVAIRNWHGGDVKPLRSGGEMAPSAVVLHESCTRGGWRRLWDVLTRRHLGIHLAVAADGSVTQHVDLLRRTVHAGSLNSRSIAIEVISAYYSDGSGEPGVDWIPAIWAHRGRYLLPTPAQCESAWKVLEWLCTGGQWPERLFVPAIDGRWTWGRVKGAAKAPGVQPHSATAHADGAFPAHYAMCRHHGLSAEDAWKATVAAAGSCVRTTALPW